MHSRKPTGQYSCIQLRNIYAESTASNQGHRSIVIILIYYLMSTSTSLAMREECGRTCHISVRTYYHSASNAQPVTTHRLLHNPPSQYLRMSCINIASSIYNLPSQYMMSCISCGLNAWQSTVNFDLCLVYEIMCRHTRYDSNQAV